ncbi:uncharacterized protein LTR77_006265 [Saxophila tyrrhenica]|uniref:Isopentenyl-diphosphate delta-isomerase n=1 Tax=Saxophila tyrrhenica TaxID=1690608 RepID=A0AAV9P7N4_9PEZI|nr:hypothetical protein LTR77_006265 [Saxophila tyrrhenica]
MSGRGRGGGGGRGQYYKNRYGGGGRGRGRGGGSGDDSAGASQQQAQTGGNRTVKDWQQLQGDLERIDRNQYGAYKQLLGSYNHIQPKFTLSIDYVQGDPYASPSRVRAVMPWSETNLPDEYFQSDARKIAVCDFVTRVAADFIRTKHLDQSLGGSGGGWSGPKGGAFNINACGQEVLPRTSALISNNDTIELRFTTTLPAAGRTILGEQAWQILGVNLVELVQKALLHANLDQQKLQQHVLSVERQRGLREQLASHGLIAFVANGSILPRSSGASSRPMDNAVPFQSPKESEVTLKLPNGSTVQGMGIPKGITLLTGGGFHGKSTVLEALELGVYDHVPGDGRELIVTDPTAVKIRAEDGRSVTKTDISPFISNLPGGKDTRSFSTDDASGSTSMASSIQEALEAGCTTLLIDEDSSATNLLVRDQRMQALIKKEPIMPLISKAKALHTQHGVSTIIVVGGLGDWLTVADNVIAMDAYTPHNITTNAAAIVSQYPSVVHQDEKYGSLPLRKFQVNLSGLRSPFAPRKDFINLRPQAKDPVSNPAEAESGIDLSALDQVVEVGQARMIATLLSKVAEQTAMSHLDLSALLKALDGAVGTEMCLPAALGDGELVAVRRFELAAALSRLRGLVVTC